MKTRPLCFVCLCFLILQVVLVIVISGKSMSEVPASSIFYDGKEKSVFIRGQVYKKTNTSNFQILYLKNDSVDDSNMMVYDKKFIDIAIGQTICLQGTTNCFDEARNPGNYDQRMHYVKQKIYGMVWCEKVLFVSGEERWLMENLYQLKMYWKERIYEAMGEENGAILVAMLLGEKGDMDAEMKELYQKSGIGHILAISGLHISFIGLGIYKLIRKTGLGYIQSGLLGVFILSLYVLMLGFTVSVIRAYVMLLFRVGADMSGRVYDMLTALMVAAVITVGVHPLYLADAGFLLSYGAILGILFVLPMLEQLFPSRLKPLAGCYASIAINIVLFPVLLYFYYEFPIYSVLLNVLVVPLMSVVLGVGMLGSLMGLFVLPIGKLCLQICDWLLSLFEFLSRVCSRLPFARIVFGQPELWEMVIYYIVLLAVVVCVSGCKKKECLRRLRVCFFMVCCALIALMTYRPSRSLAITMLDVGQGDGIFMRGPKGNTYLIDGGSSDVEQLGKYRIEPFLKSQGVGELDYVFVTHGDADHYSGILEMLDRQDVGVKIRHLVLPSNWNNDDSLVKLAKMAKQQGISVAVIKAGECLLEGDLRLQCIQPTETDAWSGNAGSMVLSVYFKQFSMLCTGDVETEGETALTKRLTGQTFDVLKVAHHGSKNSSTEQFLKVIQPEITLISVGENNSYGHPHKETMDRLENVGSKIFETITNGAITIQTDGNSLTIDCFLL